MLLKSLGVVPAIGSGRIVLQAQFWWYSCRHGLRARLRSGLCCVTDWDMVNKEQMGEGKPVSLICCPMCQIFRGLFVLMQTE